MNTQTVKTRYVYELVYSEDRIPFYIGQSDNPRRRLQQHRSASKRGTYLVYQTIRKLESDGITWTMQVVTQYDQSAKNGSYEDDQIIKRLREGHRLSNEKKGSPNWMTKTIAMAEDMNRRGLPSGTTRKQYREILSREEQQRKADLNHQRWLEEQANLEAKLAREQDEWSKRLKEKAKNRLAREQSQIDNMKLQAELAERRVKIDELLVKFGLKRS